MATLKRYTDETQIEVTLNVYGSGKSSINSGVGFLDHMLTSFAKHALIDLDVRCQGDTHIDDHHSVEDIAIVIGQAIYEELYPIANVERFGNGTVVMDEASVTCDLDLSNRPFLYYEIDIDGKIGQFDVELAEEFFRALVFNAHISAHIVMNRGKNRHHIIEAAFKAFALAFRRATSRNERLGVPSTKGVL
jgi:imidazoleglycerol-phosphate dehydratase